MREEGRREGRRGEGGTKEERKGGVSMRKEKERMEMIRSELSEKKLQTELMYNTCSTI